MIKHVKIVWKIAQENVISKIETTYCKKTLKFKYFWGMALHRAKREAQGG